MTRLEITHLPGLMSAEDDNRRTLQTSRSRAGAGRRVEVE